MSFDFKKGQTVEFPWEHRQCLGRLFRVGQPKLVLVVPSVEEQIARKIENKLILLGGTTEGVGESLHLLPCQEIHVKRMIKDLTKPDSLI